MRPPPTRSKQLSQEIAEHNRQGSAADLDGGAVRRGLPEAGARGVLLKAAIRVGPPPYAGTAAEAHRCWVSIPTRYDAGLTVFLAWPDPVGPGTVSVLPR